MNKESHKIDRKVWEALAHPLRFQIMLVLYASDLIEKRKEVEEK